MRDHEALGNRFRPINDILVAFARESLLGLNADSDAILNATVSTDTVKALAGKGPVSFRLDLSWTKEVQKQNRTGADTAGTVNLATDAVLIQPAENGFRVSLERKIPDTETKGSASAPKPLNLEKDCANFGEMSEFLKKNLRFPERKPVHTVES